MQIKTKIGRKGLGGAGGTGGRGAYNLNFVVFVYR